MKSKRLTKTDLLKIIQNKDSEISTLEDIIEKNKAIVFEKDKYIGTLVQKNAHDNANASHTEKEVKNLRIDKIYQAGLMAGFVAGIRLAMGKEKTSKRIETIIKTQGPIEDILGPTDYKGNII